MPWLYNGGGLDLWREAYKPFNLIAFPMGNTDIQMGGWFNKPIDSLDDIAGLRMRIPRSGRQGLEKGRRQPGADGRRRDLYGAGTRHDRRHRVGRARSMTCAWV